MREAQTAAWPSGTLRHTKRPDRDMCGVGVRLYYSASPEGVSNVHNPHAADGSLRSCLRLVTGEQSPRVRLWESDWLRLRSRFGLAASAAPGSEVGRCARQGLKMHLVKVARSTSDVCAPAPPSPEGCLMSSCRQQSVCVPHIREHNVSEHVVRRAA